MKKLEEEKNKNNNKSSNNKMKKRSQSTLKYENHELTYVPLSNPIGHNGCFIHTSIHLLFNCIDLSNFLIQKDKFNYLREEILYGLLKFFVEYNNKSKSKINLPENYKKYLLNTLDTESFRMTLSIYSNKKFPFKTMGDPVELIIFLLENLCKIDTNFIHELFYIDLIEEYICLKCANKNYVKYDKDHFVMEIYIEEILNYIKLTNMEFDFFNNHLFIIEKDISGQYTQDCDKCKNKNQIIKKRICNHLPKYFFINCVWSNRNPNKDSIIKVFSLIQFSFKGSDVYEIKENKKYFLYGMILFCYYMAHYIFLLYDKNQNIFVLYNDEYITKFNNYLEICEYLTGKNGNDRNMFYPVFLAYQEDNEEDIPDIKMSKEYFDNLIKKINTKDTDNKENKNITPGNNDDINNKTKNILNESKSDKISIMDQMIEKTENTNFYKDYLNSTLLSSKLFNQNNNNKIEDKKSNTRTTRTPSLDSYTLNKSIKLAGEETRHLYNNTNSIMNSQRIIDSNNNAHRYLNNSINNYLRTSIDNNFNNKNKQNEYNNKNEIINLYGHTKPVINNSYNRNNYNMNLNRNNLLNSNNNKINQFNNYIYPKYNFNYYN